MPPSSFRIILTLSFLLFPSISADIIEDACSKTKQTQLCVETLQTFSESKEADLAKLTNFVIGFTSNTGVNISTFISDAMTKADGNAKLLQCLTDCKELFIDGVDQLNTCQGTLPDRKYKHAVMVTMAAVADGQSCTEGCDSVKDQPEAMEMIKKANHFVDLCSIVIDLISPLMIQ